MSCMFGIFTSDKTLQPWLNDCNSPAAQGEARMLLDMCFYGVPAPAMRAQQLGDCRIMEQIKLKRASGSHPDSSPAPCRVTYEFCQVWVEIWYFTQNGGLKLRHVPQPFKIIKQRPFGGCCLRARRAHCLRGKKPARIWQGICCITENDVSGTTDLDHDATFKGELLSAEESSGTWLSKQSIYIIIVSMQIPEFLKHKGHINV